MDAQTAGAGAPRPDTTPDTTLAPAADHGGCVSRCAVIRICLLALVVRVAWGVLVPVGPVSDSQAYLTFAQNVASGGGYGWRPGEPSAFWAPGTSLLYAALFRVFGEGFAPIVAVNVVLGVVGVWLTLIIAARLLGPRAGIIAGVIAALWPFHIEFTTILASELPCTTLSLAGMAAWIFWRDRPAARIIVGGVLFALAAYTRPTALLVPVIISGLDFLRGPDRGRTFVHAALLGLVMAATIAPWTIRNARVFDGAFVPISTNDGANFWMGNNPETTGHYQPLPDWVDGMGEVERNRALKRAAMQYIAEEPVAFLKRTGIKLVLLHDRQTMGITWNKGLERVFPEPAIKALKLAGQAYWLGVLALGVAGVWLLLVRRGVWAVLLSPIVAIWAYYALSHAIIVVQDRYLYPATPMIAMLAGFALAAAWQARERRRQPAA